MSNTRDQASHEDSYTSLPTMVKNGVSTLEEGAGNFQERRGQVLDRVDLVTDTDDNLSTPRPADHSYTGDLKAPSGVTSDAGVRRKHAGSAQDRLQEKHNRLLTLLRQYYLYCKAEREYLESIEKNATQNPLGQEATQDPHAHKNIDWFTFQSSPHSNPTRISSQVNNNIE